MEQSSEPQREVHCEAETVTCSEVAQRVMELGACVAAPERWSRVSSAHS